MANWKWSQQKRLAAMYYAMGRTKKWIEDKLLISGSTLDRWEESPEWLAFVDDVCEKHAEVMKDMLEDAEKTALLVMTELAVESEDDEVRLKAAESLLNRAGKRGKPVDQVEQRSVAITGDMNTALQRALADPGVLARLTGSNIMIALPAGQPVPSGGEAAARGVSPSETEPDYEIVPCDATGPSSPPA